MNLINASSAIQVFISAMVNVFVLIHSAKLTILQMEIAFPATVDSFFLEILAPSPLHPSIKLTLHLPALILMKH